MAEPATVEQRLQAAINSGFSEADAKRVVRYFSVYDMDSSGRIDQSELRRVMQMFGCDLSDHAVAKLLADADTNSDGTIDFEEFCQMLLKKRKEKSQREEKLREAFSKFDTDESGLLSRDELSEALTSLGMEPFSDQEISDMLDMADLDGDGQLSIEEFVRILTLDIEDMIDES